MKNQLIINANMLSLTGCFKAKTSENGKYKLRIIKDSDAFIYDINTQYQTYPLQLGEGKYNIILYKHIIDKKYALASKVQLINKNNNYILSSNQYVDYENIDILFDVIKDFLNDDENIVIKKIQDYILKNFTYDTNKAKEIKSKHMINKLPNIQECLEKHKGICQDLAALSVALFRINNIPAKLNIGYVKNQYHAWVQFFYNKKWNIFDPTAEIENKSILNNEYHVERWY